MNEDYVSLAVLINLVERLRAEQVLVKSMLASMIVQMDLIKAHTESAHAQAIVASDARQKVRYLRDAGSPVATHPTGGKPGA